MSILGCPRRGPLADNEKLEKQNFSCGDINDLARNNYSKFSNHIGWLD
jgi:hypothetical protein